MPQSHISHQFSSPIWRLEIDNLKDVIVAETRDAAEKQVHFAAIDLKTGNVYFDNFQTEERWLTGIEAAYDGVLLIHNYQNESGPAHKGLIAVNETSGDVLWMNYNLSFDYLSINGPVCYDARFQPRKLVLTDIKTGATIRPYEPSIDLELANGIVLPEEQTDEIVLAMHLPATAVQNSVHYVEHYNLRIVSLHAITAGVLQQRLYVMQGADIVFEDLLNTDIQKLQPESFLLYKHYLIYLKNRSQLRVLNLNEV